MNLELITSVVSKSLRERGLWGTLRRATEHLSQAPPPPMETALRHIVDLEFDKFELALVEEGQHLRLSEACDDPDAAVARLRQGPSLIPSSIYADFGLADWENPQTVQRFEGLCKRNIAKRDRVDVGLCRKSFDDACTDREIFSDSSSNRKGRSADERISRTRASERAACVLLTRYV